MSDENIIPNTPSSADYAAEPDRELIPDVADPFALMTQWLKEARASEINDSNAMSLATVDANGMPDVRMVLLKDVSADGFTFYTNLESTKAGQLNTSGAAAICFHWKSLRRQLRARGKIIRVSDAEADAYYNSRARASRIGAWASDQSRPLESRAVLKAKTDELTALYGDDKPIPRPPYWGGYRIVPQEIEFWQDQAFRLHDRLRFYRSGAEQAWTTTRLNP